MSRPNTQVSVAREYPESTEHSYISIRTDQRYLDWGNKPLLYKVYLELTRPAISTSSTRRA